MTAVRDTPPVTPEQLAADLAALQTQAAKTATDVQAQTQVNTQKTSIDAAVATDQTTQAQLKATVIADINNLY
jgi:hypothetical protein